MFCTRCGTANPDDGQFCVKCGTVLNAQASGPAAGRMAGAYIEPTETSGKAIGSLICGILFFLFPAAIVAIVLGHLSLSDIRKAGGRLGGRGMAVAGLVLGYSGVLIIPFVMIMAAIAIPNLLRARIAANEASAVGSLRTISVAAITYSATYSNGFPPGLEALGGPGSPSCDHAALIESMLASGRKAGYVFTYTPQFPAGGQQPLLSPTAAAKGCTNPGAPRYSATADPIQPGSTGQRSFFTDQTGVIRYATSGSATTDSPPIE
jgi:type IV pilus assembly protein PilA